MFIHMLKIFDDDDFDDDDTHNNVNVVDMLEKACFSVFQ
jgi:hypothetical protein